MRQMLEEDRVRHQPRHRNDLPAGVAQQDVAEALEVRDAIGFDRQCLQAGDELIAGAAAQQCRLALVQRLPHRVFGCGVVGPALRDGPVSAVGSRALAGS